MRQRDRQTDRQTDRKRDRQTETETEHNEQYVGTENDLLKRGVFWDLWPEGGQISGLSILRRADPDRIG